MDTRDKTIPFEAPASNEKDYNLLAKIGKLYHVLYPHSMRKNVHLPAIIGNLYSWITWYGWVVEDIGIKGYILIIIINKCTHSSLLCEVESS